MTAKQTVQALYAAYATGDSGRIAALLHPDVVWVAPLVFAVRTALPGCQSQHAALESLGQR
jgi:ketosteroid isomerase-like protein